LIDADGGGDPFGDIQDCLSASTQTLPWCFSNGEDGFCNQAESSGSQWACCIGWEADSHCESVGPGRMDCCHDDPITGDYCCQFNSTTAADGGVNPPCE
jgi:hypothetical protein